MNIVIAGGKRVGKTAAVNTALKKNKGFVSGFHARFDGLRERCGVILLTVTGENRDEIPARILNLPEKEQ